MSTTIQLGTFTSDRRDLRKSYNLGNSIACEIKEARSITKPVFIVGTDKINFGYNYLYCSNFGRYYFIDNMTVEPGQRIAIHCSVDVLETYKSGIQALSVNVIRQENQYKDYLPDSKFVLLNKFDKITKLFPTQPFSEALSASTDSYVLAIAGNENPYVGGVWQVDGYTIVSVEPADWSSNWRNYYVNASNQAPQDVDMTTVGTFYVSQPTFASVKARWHTVYKQN